MSDNEKVQIIEDQDTEMIDASAETKTEPGLLKVQSRMIFFLYLKNRTGLSNTLPFS